MPRYTRCLIICLLALAIPRALLAQPAFLVEDVNTNGVSPSANPAQQFTTLGTTLFFVYNDGVHGDEIWKTDGTGPGTTLLIDACPGICSGPYSLTVSNGLLFFIADDGAHGSELWKSDGTAAGTVLVKDVYPGRAPGFPSNYLGSLFDAGGVLYFAADDGEHGVELWKSDGTAAGTVLVKDIQPGPAGSVPWPWAVAGGVLLLQADDGSHGREPWVSNGTEGGTVLAKDVFPGSASSIATTIPDEDRRDAAVAPWGGFLFQAAGELWRTDGTEAGTSLVKEINIAGSSDPSGFTALGSKVFFSALDPGNGRELWMTDGTSAGTTLVKDVNPGDVHSNPGEITLAAGRLFFRALDDAHGYELWTSDGTAAGTSLVKDIWPGTTSGLAFFPNAITPFGDGVLFFSFGIDLWRSDGTEAGTVSVPTALHPVAAQFVRKSWAAVGSSFFFSTFGQSFSLPSELWKGDASGADQIPLSPGAPWSLHPQYRGTTGVDHDFVAGGNRLIFTADEVNTSFNLWASDATPGGTARIVSGFVAGNLTPTGDLTFLTLGFDLATTDGTSAGTQMLSNSFFVSGEIAALGSSVLYPCEENSSIGNALCKSNGTPAGTDLVTHVSTNLTPYKLKTSGSNVFFVAGDFETGEELWKSDGTEAGTLLVRDIWPDEEDSSPDRLTDVAGTLFFSAATGGEGRELWKSDGTETGTVLVKDIRPGQGSSMDRTRRESGSIDWGGSTAAVGTRLFFVADDGTSGSELWKSDGTAAGTVLVKDVLPGPAGSEPFELTRVGNRVFFAAGDGVHGRELWVSDGTAAGTRMVADLLPGAGNSLPQDLRAVGHVLLFAATDGVHGLEAWRTNGTAAGTRMIQDIAPGPLPSSPVSFTSAGSHVFFGANDGATGMEPWAVPRSNVLATFGDVPVDFWAWPFVEALAGAGLTGGCAPGLYCPETNVSRAETAVFLLRGINGVDFTPPAATGTVFQDVPAGYWAAPWIERFAADGFTSGCSLMPPLYCPAQALSRAEMAVFLLRAKHGTGYTPPPATGTVFTDVPTGYWAAAWIEQLAAEGITAGCAPGSYCPDSSVTRAQMAVFLTRTFNLPLPPP